MKLSVMPETRKMFRGLVSYLVLKPTIIGFAFNNLVTHYILSYVICL